MTATERPTGDRSDQHAVSDVRRRHSAPRILLIGTYSSLNKGDATLQLTAANLLRARFPAADISICAPFPDMDRQAYAPFRVVRSSRRNLPYATFLLLRAWLWRVTRRLPGKSPHWLIARTELQSFEEADLVIDLSGDMLTEDYGPHVTWSHFMPIMTGLLLGKPVMICAQSIGPFKLTAPLARRVLDRVAAITVRDRITLDYLQGMRLSRGDVELTADLCFSLQAAAPARAREILAAENIDPASRPLLGIAVSRLIEDKFWNKFAMRARLGTDFRSFFADLLDKAAAALDCEIVFIPHVIGPRRSADDRVLSRQIAACMRSDAKIVQGDYTPAELKAVIAECHLFLGTRMHAILAAVTSGVPTVAIAYSHKTSGVMSLLHLDDYVIHLREMTVASLLQRLKKADAGRDIIKETVHTHLPDISAQSQRNIDIAAGLLAH